MKGFVPVTKASILSMLDNCETELRLQVEKEVLKRVEYLIKAEQERCSKRRFFGLLKPHQPRFEYTEAGARERSAKIKYELFDGDPFRTLENDASNSERWIARLRKVAKSENAGEPILLEMSTFMRISQPARYLWADSSPFYYSITD